MKITASIANGYSAELIQASRILRLGGQALALFLADEASINPSLVFMSSPGCSLLPSATKSIRDELRNALTESATPPPLWQLVVFLIENINDDGQLDWDDEMEAQLVETHGRAKLMTAIKILQSLGPPGVGARNNKECLLLQLDASSQRPVTMAARNIADNYLHWFLRKRWDKLPQRHLAEATVLLESLTLRPGATLLSSDTTPLLPDVDFFQEHGLWKIRMGAGDCFPRNVGHGSPEERLRARRIVSAVAARRKQLLRLGQYIANQQSAFLSGAEPVPRSLPMLEAAAALGVSSGMISHIVAGKIFCAPCGIFALKLLFARKTSGGQSIAAVRQEIINIVSCENPTHPHTDEQLRMLLRVRGMSLARRTVSKYRAAAGIFRPSLRKQLPTLQR